MSNLLRNPNLAGFTLGRYFTQKDGSVGTIEFPNEWEFQAIPRDPSDPEKLVQSLHRDKGFGMSAGFRSWEGGYIQRGISLKANTRYLAKAAIQPHVGFTSGQVDLTAVTWRIVIESPAGTIAQDWQVTGKTGYGNYEEVYFPFHSAIDTTVTFQFWGRSVYAGNSCELQVLGLSLEAAEPNAGGPGVPVIGGTAAAATGASAPVAASSGSSGSMGAPKSTGSSGSMGASAGTGSSGSMGAASGSSGSLGSSGSSGSMGAAASTPAPSSTGGAQLEQVITNDDIAVITAGLRAMGQVITNPTVTAGFERLAQVLERLKK